MTRASLLDSADATPLARMWEEQVVAPAEAALPSAVAAPDSASAIHR
jgi:hypothetical protein